MRHSPADDEHVEIACATDHGPLPWPRQLPDALNMSPDMADIEAPPPPVLSDDDWDDDEDDGWLLHCFTVSTGTCAGFHSAVQSRMLMCGIYLRDRRFWVCKVIIVRARWHSHTAVLHF